MTNTSDAELAQALIDQKPGAATEAHQRFTPLVRGVLKRGLGSTQELEDVEQEVFMCLFRRVPTLRDPLAIRGFVIAIAANTVLFERRRRKKRNRLQLEPNPMRLDLAHARESTASSFAWLRLGRLLRRLKERERATFMLRFVERRTTSEVARAVGISEPTARRSFGYAWERMNTWASRDPFLADYFVHDLSMPLE